MRPSAPDGLLDFWTNGWFAGLEACDTADSEVCATGADGCERAESGPGELTAEHEDEEENEDEDESGESSQRMA
jgi:hypothetical protein